MHSSHSHHISLFLSPSLSLHTAVARFGTRVQSQGAVAQSLAVRVELCVAFSFLPSLLYCPFDGVFLAGVLVLSCLVYLSERGRDSAVGYYY